MSLRERDQLKVLAEVEAGHLAQREAAARAALASVRERYRDLGPKLAAECPARDSGVQLSRETLRLMAQAGLWRARPPRVREVHQWRPRRSSAGELLQWDTSVHAWLEERGPAKMYLVALIDDATSRLFARFVPADSAAHHMRVLWAYLERHGRPQAVYTDRAGLFQPPLPRGWKSEEPGPRTETQIGRALRELGDRVDRGALAAGEGAD